MARELTASDRWTFNEGTHRRLYEVLGAHLSPDHTSFRVWAPNARAVSVVGDFNGWDPATHPMQGDPSGIWQMSATDVAPGDLYKYAITTAYNVPFLWYQRIIVNNKKVRGWQFSPSQYILQDLTQVWLDQ